MAIKGMAIIKTKDESRVKEISEYIWGLSFKKNVRVDVAIYHDEPHIDAYVSKTRYAIKVNPQIELAEIKNFLLEKGYITDD